MKRRKRRFKRGKIKDLKKCKNGNWLKYRSSYEEKFIQLLEKSDACEYYLYEKIKIPYRYYGKDRNYIPDFIVKTKNKNFIIEVKPKDQINLPKNRAKFEAVRKLLKDKKNWEFKIVTENLINTIND